VVTLVAEARGHETCPVEYHMSSFKIDSYKRFLKIAMRTCKIVPLTEYRIYMNNNKRNFIGLRHDISSSIEYLLPIIKAEQLLGVRSAIFLSSWNSRIWKDKIDYLKELENEGFEIGLLYATISEYIISRFMKTQREIFQQGLNILREYFTIYGCSSHEDEIGNKFKYSNYCIFKEGADKWRKLNQFDDDIDGIDAFPVSPTVIPIGELLLEEFDLDYEAHLLPGEHIYINKFTSNNDVSELIGHFVFKKELSIS
jgi:hypothetical protein